MISFDKYQGAGNYFVIIDDREKAFDEGDSELIRAMCDRHFGIGADGLMLLRNHDTLDFEMLYFNSDGRVSSMCGNGGRCIVQYANSLGIIGAETRFKAIDGEHKAELIDASLISLEMLDVDNLHSDGEALVLNTGSPHFVTEVENLDELDVVEAARAIRYNKTYMEAGINVNFIEYIPEGLKIRTYERGVEDETLACGTGVAAAALVAARKRNLKSPIKVQALGGELEVKFESTESGGFTGIWKTGPAKFVFSGTFAH